MRQARLPALLLVLTCLSTTYVGALYVGTDPFGAPGGLLRGLRAGLPFSVPLMSILLAHEFGHYIAARIHRVPASLPFFIPLPIGVLGTMGAVILMPDRIHRRNALFDIGAAGPLAGMAVALPVLAYGLDLSMVGPQGADGGYTQEGHSLLYMAMLWLVKGPIPAGHDIHLGPTALAGWTGLLVTMINLIPTVQLDGGHVAYALWGARQERFSRRVRAVLPAIAACVSLGYTAEAFLEDRSPEGVRIQLLAGMHWLVWWALLRLMARRQGEEHPPTDDHQLSPRRTWLARGTLLLFVLLFMPSWMRTVLP